MNISKNLYLFKAFVTTLLLVIVSTAVLTAQTEISLEEAISYAKQHNRSIKIASQSTDIQKATLEQTKANFRPYFGLQATDVVSNNPLNVFGFKLLQERVQQSDFNPALLNDPTTTNQFNVRLNAMMPLLNMEAKSKQKAVLSQIDMQEAMVDRTKQGIELEVTKSYYMLLLAQRAVQVLEDTYDAAVANYEIADNFFSQGLLLKSELLEMQIMVNQSELALGTAQMNLANSQAAFNHLINTSEYTEYMPIDTLGEQDIMMIDDDVVNADRADFRAMQHSITALHHMMDASEKSFIPKLQAFGSYEVNDEVPFENVANNYQVGLTMSWDIYTGNMRKASTTKAKAEINKQQMVLDQKRADASLEMTNTRRAIDDLKNQISLHNLSISQTEEALRIIKNRFEQGLEKSSDVVNVETDLSQKKLARLHSLFELNMKNAYLNFILK